MPGVTSRATTLLCLAGVLACALAGAQGARAASPWWHLTSTSRPSELHAGQAQDEVQQLEVLTEEREVEPGVFEPVSVFELVIGGVELGFFATEPFGSFGPAPTAQNIQQAIESVQGAGSVTVEGELGSAHPFLIKTRDLLTLAVRPLAGTATATVRNEGRSDGQIVLTAANLGDAVADGACTRTGANTGRYHDGACTEEVAPGAGEYEKEPIQIADKLPPGLTAVGLEVGHGGVSSGSCSLRSLSCTYSSTVRPYQQLEVLVDVNVSGQHPEASNQVTVSGAGVTPITLQRPVREGSAPVPFGVSEYGFQLEEAGGTPAAQAGRHPFQLTTTLTLDQTLGERTGAGGERLLLPTASAEPKDLSFHLPPGLIGNPSPFKRCTIAQFLAPGHGGQAQCPLQSVLGVAMVTIAEPNAVGVITVVVPVFNLEPLPGEPARFGFRPEGEPVFIDTSLRTGGDYGVTANVQNITQDIQFLQSQVIFWGVPGAAAHDLSRGYACLGAPVASCPTGEETPPPFLSLPTSCSGEPLQSEVLGDSWSEPSPAGLATLAATQMSSIDGCDHLSFSAQISLAPDGAAASTPSGLTADVHIPQQEALNPNGLAPSELKDVSVTLPQGVVLNPAAADGLLACSEAQIALHSPAESTCPEASKIANVTIKTPLLPPGQWLRGFVYLASPQNFTAPPQENPFQSLIAMYLVAKDPVSGALVKLPGQVSLSESGQITTTFANNPQLPFEDAELEFFGGDRAPLATPARCGSYTTQATFTPWSGGEPVNGSSTFKITSGANGAPCPSSLPFAPTVTSGSPNNNAGSFSPLTTTISREDGSQDLQSVVLHYPPGVSGIVAGVPLCPEAQANAGTCPPASLIGETTVSVGLGGDPFTVTGGKVYLTEKYLGAPFGLSIVNPAKAGPFVLQEGRPVIVRAAVQIDPYTAALTVTTGTIPHIIDGIPLQIRHVNVLVNRPGFTFNPTNCNQMSIGGTIVSDEGASAPVSAPFHVTNCATLKFAPKFAVSTSGKTSKAYGASLTVKLSYPKAPFGSYSNIAKVKVDLPKQLPSRLTTLQKACLATVFEANPANCPPASIVGHATAITPLLPVPLTGPAYLRLTRQRSVPQPDHGSAGLRSDHRYRWLHVHQAWDHEHYVQGNTGRPI